MRRTVNFKFIAISLLTGVLVVAGVHLLHGYQTKRNARSLKIHAATAEENGDIAKSLDLLGRYLRFAPADVDALFKMGTLAAEHAEKRGPKQMVAAFFLLNRVLLKEEALQPEQVQSARRKLVDVAMKIGRYGDARTQIDRLLAAREKTPSVDKERAELQFLCGVSWRQETNYAEAVKWFKDARDTDPGLLRAYLEAALLYRDKIQKSEAQRKNEKAAGSRAENPAEAILNEMVKYNGQSLDAWIFRANFHLTSAKTDRRLLDAARKDLKEAEKIDPKNARVILNMGLLAWENGDKAQARDILDKGIKLHPGEQGMYIVLAKLEAADDKIDRALEILAKGADVLTKKEETLNELANLLIVKGDLEKAQKQLEKLENAGYSQPILKYHAARIAMKGRKWGPAAETLAAIRDQLLDQPALIRNIDELLGECYQRLGNPDQALLAYQNAITYDLAHSIQPRLKLAQALASAGRVGAAISEYTQVAILAEGEKAVRLEAEKDARAKEKISKDWTQRLGGISLQLAQLLIQRNLRQDAKDRDWRSVRERLAEAKQRLGDQPEIRLLEADTHLQEISEQEVKDKTLLPALVQARLKAARKVLKEALIEHPDELRLWLAAAILEGRDKATPALQAEAALKKLDEAARRSAKLKDSGELKLERLRFVIQTPNAAKALAQFEKEALAASGTERAPMLNTLASAYFAVGDYPAARRIWQALAEDQPENLGVRLLLFDLALLPRDLKEAIAIKEQIKSLENQRTGTYWRYAEASLILADTPEDDKPLDKAAEVRLGLAYEYLREAAKLRPTWERVIAQQGQIDRRQGRFDAAIEKLQRAVDLGDRQPGTIGKLWRLLYKRNRGPEADTLVNNFLNQRGGAGLLLSARLGQPASEWLLRSKKIDLAVDLAHNAVSRDSKDYRDHLWLGTILANKNDKKAKDEARVEFDKACALKPEEPMVWTQLVLFLMREGQKAEAEKVIARAAQNLPADKAPLTLAHCYEAVGDITAAEKHFKAAHEAKQGDLFTIENLAAFYTRRGEPKKAAEYWQQIAIKGEGTLQKAGRRNLAIAKGIGGDYESFTEALKLIDLNLKETERNSPADLLAKALLLAARPGHRDDAIRIFEEMDRQQFLTAQHRFTLAQLYSAADNWPKVQFQMSLLLSAADKNKKSTAFYSFFIRALLAKAQAKDGQPAAWLAQAKSWLERMKHDFGGDLVTLATEARVLQAQGKKDEALARLTELRGNRKVDPGRLAPLVEGLAGEGQGRDAFRELAENLYRDKVRLKEDQGSLLALAGFLGRNKRPDEAFEKCEKALAQGRTEPVLAVAMGVLRASGAERKYAERLESWIQDKLKGKDPSPTLLEILADLRDWQERFGDAADLYRQIIDKSPHAIVALNNRAWILAHQGRPDEGLKLIEAAIAVAGPMPELLDTRGVVHLLAGKKSEAFQDLKTSVTAGSSPTRLCHLAQAYQALGKVAEASRTLKEAEDNRFTEAMLHPLERGRYHSFREALKTGAQPPVRAAGR